MWEWYPIHSSCLYSRSGNHIGCVHRRLKDHLRIQSATPTISFFPKICPGCSTESPTSPGKTLGHRKTGTVGYLTSRNWSLSASTFYLPYLMKAQLQGTWIWSLFLFSSNKIFVKMDYQVVFLWLDASESASQKHLTKILYFSCGIFHLLCTPNNVHKWNTMERKGISHFYGSFWMHCV